MSTVVVIPQAAQTVAVTPKGDTGDSIELQKSATHIQYKPTLETVWINLVALSEITGANGSNGTNGTNGSNGTNGTNGTDALSTTKEVDGHASVGLTADNVSNGVVFNIGQGANNVNLTLPAAVAGYSFLLTIGETSANYLRITAASAGTMIVDGVAAKDYAQFTTPTIGNYLSAFTVKVAAGYNWIITTGAGTVTTN